MTSKADRFLEEVGSVRKRPASAAGEQPGAKKQQLLLPVSLAVDHGSKEAREPMLWNLGDASLAPAAVARIFCQQHIQQPQQAEREAQRLQMDVERLLQQHKDLAAAPAQPTLVKLDVRVTLPHLRSFYYDDPLWDLSGPRAACEAYVAAVCRDLRLDWGAHSQILRKMKDAIDAASKGLAGGKVQVLRMPRGCPIVQAPPSRTPQVIRMTEQQVQQMRERAAAAAAKQGGAAPQALTPQAGLSPPGLAAAATSPAVEVGPRGPAATAAGAASEQAQQPQQGAQPPLLQPQQQAPSPPSQQKQEGAQQQELPPPAPSQQQQQPQGSEQGSGQDMPDADF